jgi:hypothetical protein
VITIQDVGGGQFDRKLERETGQICISFISVSFTFANNYHHMYIHYNIWHLQVGFRYADQKGTIYACELMPKSSGFYCH